MKFFCNGKDLAVATSVVSKILSVKNNIPILNGIKIKANGNQVTLSVYNQEIYIEKTIQAEVILEGELVVEGKIFNEYVIRISTKEKVEIEQMSNEKLSIRFNYSELEMQYYEKENFPLLEEFSSENFCEIKENELKELIDRALFCVAINNNRPLLKSCSFTVKEQSIEAVCLDGYRIAISKKEVENQNGDINFIIYGKIVSDIFKTLEDSDNTVKIKKEGNMVMFDKGHTKIKVNTIDGEIYNYKSNLPKDIRNEIIVNKGEIEDCLNRAAIICRDTTYNKITITVDEKMINIFSESEKGRINENIECKNNGEKIKIGLNCRFLQEAISKIKEDFIKLIIERPTKPILIKQIDSEEYKCIVLPLRLIG